MNWATEALGLPPDADSRAIKRADAKRLKTVRPDDDPAAFQRLHEIYQAALAWAEATVWSHASASVEDVDADVVPPLRAVVELAQWQDDAYAQDRAECILAAAHAMLAADFGPWLRALPELCSLALRPRIGQVIASRAACDGAIISDAAFEACSYWQYRRAALPETRFALLFWAISLIQDAQHQALQRHR